MNTPDQPIGFTLAGYCPCHIAKLETNSLASNAGLMLGDSVIKVNGRNVSRAKCNSIVRIIKSLNANEKIVLEILRPSSRIKKQEQQQQEEETASDVAVVAGSSAINSTENTEYAHLNQIKYHNSRCI